MTSRSRLKSPHESNRRSPNHPRGLRGQRTELTRENETKKQQPASLQQQTASITNKAFFILTKLVKFDLNAVTKQRFVRDRFPG